jgi:hypothetical protein
LKKKKKEEEEEERKILGIFFCQPHIGLYVNVCFVSASSKELLRHPKKREASKDKVEISRCLVGPSDDWRAHRGMWVLPA